METVKVTATGPDGWVVKTVARKHEVYIDQPEGMGGTDKAPTPLEYIFIALGGCLVSVAKIVAAQRKINLRGVEIEVSGEVNLDVLRGQEKNERAGFQSISAKVKVDADLTDKEKEAFLEEVEKRCPVSDNVSHATPMTIKLA